MRNVDATAPEVNTAPDGTGAATSSLSRGPLNGVPCTASGSLSASGQGLAEGLIEALRSGGPPASNASGVGQASRRGWRGGSKPPRATAAGLHPPPSGGAASAASGPPALPRTRTTDLASVLIRWALAPGCPGERAALFTRAAVKLNRCALRLGWRCKTPACPECQGRAASGHRRRLEARLRALGPGAVVVMLTLTVPCDDLETGHRVLVAALAKLRGRRWWREAVVGGEAHVEAVPSRGTVRPWLVHAHCLVALRPGGRLDPAALSAGWAAALPPGQVGRAHLDLRPVRWVWNAHLRRRISPLAWYCTKRRRSDLAKLDPAEVEGLLRYWHGRRLVLRFGAWRRHPGPVGSGGAKNGPRWTSRDWR